jgi:hypothetical protein
VDSLAGSLDQPEEAEALYEIGRRGGNGVELNVYCSLNGNPCCFVFVPQDKLDAEQRMIYGLKLFLPVSLRKARHLGKGIFDRLAHALAGGPWPAARLQLSFHGCFLYDMLDSTPTLRLSGT